MYFPINVIIKKSNKVRILEVQKRKTHGRYWI